MTGHTDTDMAARLAEVLRADGRADWLDPEDCNEMVRDLLPVVREIADQRAAEALESAADDFHLNISGRAQLRVRAATLRGEAGR